MSSNPGFGVVALPRRSLGAEDNGCIDEPDRHSEELPREGGLDMVSWDGGRSTVWKKRRQARCGRSEEILSAGDHQYRYLDL